MKQRTFKLNPLAAAVMMATASTVAFNPAFANGGGVGVAADGSAVQTYYANTYVKNDGKDGTANPVRGLRKFIDTLPAITIPGGTGTGLAVLGAANNLGQYMPLAVADTASYSNSDYYEIAVVEYAEKMHTDLVKATTLRGYVQIDRAMTNGATVDPVAVAAYNQYQAALTAYNAKLAAYQTYQTAAAAYTAASGGLSAAQAVYTSGPNGNDGWAAYNASVLALQDWTKTNNQYNAAVTAKGPADAMLLSCATLINTANPTTGGNFGYLCPNLGGWPTGVTMTGSATTSWTLSAPLTYSYVDANGVTQTANFALVQGAAPTVALPASPATKPATLTPPTVPTYTYTNPLSAATPAATVTAAYEVNLITGILSNPVNPAQVANPGTPPAVVAAPTAISATPSTSSKGIALTYLDGSPIMVYKENADHSLVQPLTPVQAYGYDKPHYLGPVILATKGKAVRMKYVNALPAGRAVTNADGSVSRNGDLFLPVDETLTGAGYGPDGATKYTQNRTALHWHGGDTPWISDGTPHQWIVPAADEAALSGVTVTPGGPNANMGRGVSQANVPDMPEAGPGAETLYWPNNMGARLMFYHDHALAITRLNVYGGTAAGYLLQDTVEGALSGAVGTSTAFAANDVNTIDGLPHTVQGAGLPGLLDEIPLVIQDKTFVPSDVAQQDALWDTKHWGTEGDLWFPHVYEINQNPAMTGNGTNPVGRWDYGPWFWPVFPAPLQLPTGAYGDVTTTPEGFMDTPIVNGTAYPTITVDPKAYRLRILSAGNDRMLNLNFFVADPTVTTADGRTGTEVKMVPFTSPNTITAVTYTCPTSPAGTVTSFGTVQAPGWTEVSSSYPVSFPCAGGLDGTGWGQADNRPGGVPFPGVPNADGSFNTAVAGPHFIQIGNEGGLLPNPVDIPPTVANYEYNKRSVTVLNVLERGLFLAPAERADVVVDFSAYAGKTLILYNDSPAPLPAGDPRIDYYTGDGDQTGAGGAPNTLPGFGPNTRTVMQFKVSNATPAAPFNVAALQIALPQAYAASQEKPFVTESAYNNAFLTTNGDSYGTIFAGSSIQPNFVFTPTTQVFQKLQSISLVGKGVGYTVAPNVVLSGAGMAAPITIAPVAGTTGAQIAGGKVTSIMLPTSWFTSNATALATLTTAPIVKIVSNTNANGIAVGQGASALAFTDQTVSAPAQMKAIQELFDPSYGRMNATLGVELPFTSPLNQTTIPLGYIDPTTEDIPENQIQIWKITHNGVDTHPVHFHLFNLQVINRVGWDGTIKPPYDNEQGWKETLKMNPLEDVYVAVKPRTPVIPFGVKDSVRLMDPSQPVGAITGFTQIDPMTGAAPIDPVTGLTVQVTNASKSYGWEYVWHCHILGHEENDFMRPINFAYASVIPSAPTPLTATGFTANTASSVTLTWTDPTPAAAAATAGNKQNEIGFIVSRAAASSNTFTEIGRTLANATSFVDTVTAATGYKYQVVAYNQAGNSVPASASVGTATGPAAPFAVTNLTASPNSATQVTLQWRDRSGGTGNGNGPVAETGFVVSRAVVTGAGTRTGSYTQIAVAPLHNGVSTGNNPGTSWPTYVDTTAQPGTSYKYQVIATNAGSNSAAVTSATVTTPAAPSLNAPSNVSVQMTGANSFIISFTDLAASETGYVVQVSTDSGKNWGDGTNTTATQVLPAYLATAGASGGTGLGVNITINNPVTLTLTSGAVPYLFRVAARQVNGTTTTLGNWGNLATIDLSGQTVIAAATGLTAGVANTTSIPLTWVDNANNNASYSVDVSTNGTTWTSKTTKLAGNATNYTVTGLTAGTKYQFRVRAVSLGTNASSYATVSANTLFTPLAAAPTLTLATGTSVNASWNAVTGAASYLVQTSVDNGVTWTAPASQTTTTASVTVASGNTVLVKVAAVSASGVSSAYTTSLPLNVAAPVAPAFGNSTALSASGFTLNWAAVSGASTYLVTGPGASTTAVPGTSMAISGQAANTSYSYTITAANIVGTSAASGAKTQVTLAAAPAAPTVVSVTRGTGGNSSNDNVILTLPAVGGTNTAGLTYTVQRATNAGFTQGVNTITTTAPASATATSSYTASVPRGSGTTANPASYYFRLVANNAAGASANGTVSAAVTTR